MPYIPPQKFTPKANLGGNFFADAFALIKTAVVTGAGAMVGSAQEQAAAASKAAIDNLTNQSAATAAAKAAADKAAADKSAAEAALAATLAAQGTPESPMITFLKTKGGYIAAGLGGVVLLTTLMRRK